MNEDKSNDKRKVNKNAVPRRSKSAFKSKNSEIKGEQSKRIENELSRLHIPRSELDETADSNLDSITPSSTRGIVAPLSNTPCRNEEETDDVRTDGPQSEVVPSGSRDPISSVTKLCTRSSSSELILSDGMFDFVILHTDKDTEAACDYKAHLHRDTGINDLKIDLLSNIDAGKSKFQILNTVHERYRSILIYVTDNLASDRYYKFLEEVIITCGLREANGKEDRVVPVFTKEGRCNIIELDVINGFQYFKFSSGGNMKNMYINSVKQDVERKRKMFP